MRAVLDANVNISALLLPLKRYRGIPIVSPAEFLEQIG